MAKRWFYTIVGGLFLNADAIASRSIPDRRFFLITINGLLAQGQVDTHHKSAGGQPDCRYMRAANRLSGDKRHSKLQGPFLGLPPLLDQVDFRSDSSHP